MKQPSWFYGELNRLPGRNETKDEVRIIESEHNVVVREHNLADFLNQRFASQGWTCLQIHIYNVGWRIPIGAYFE